MNQEHDTTEKRNGKHLCLWERKEIEAARRRGAGIREIARALNRNPSTVCREIKRGSVTQRKEKTYISSRVDDPDYIEQQIYFADTGQRVARNNTGRRGGKYKLFQDPGLVRYIEDKILREKWSPAAVTGWLNEQGHGFATMVCFKTVYNYIERGQLAVKNIDLLQKVRRKTKKKRIRQQRRMLGRSIDERPATVNERQEFGHWEGDTMVGKGHKSAILTLVERKTNKGIMLALKDKSASAVTAALATLKDLPYYARLFRSITLDNGSEFVHCAALETESLHIYFAHPYSAWERGANENYNGIIRRYIPKGKDMTHYTQADLNRINHQIDSLPRKRHGYKTAEMMFNTELEKLALYP